VLEAKRGHSFSNPARLVPIERLRLALGYSTEAAAPSAEVSQKHKGGCLMVPAFADIGTLRRFANCMQVQSARQALEVMIIVAHGRTCPQPFRLGLRPTGRKVNLDEFYRAGHKLLILLLYRCSRLFPLIQSLR